MKYIQIKATPFFDLLKTKDQSMWDIFSQMIDGEPKELIFLDEKEQFLFGYRLPATLEEMKKDREIFSEKYAEKIIINN